MMRWKSCSVTMLQLPLFVVIVLCNYMQMTGYMQLLAGWQAAAISCIHWRF